MNRRALGWALAASMVSSAAMAAEWKGEAELGWVATAGNTETRTLNFKSKLGQRAGGWENSAQVEVLNASNQGATSAERYGAKFQTRRELGAAGYVYGLVDGTYDRFSGIPYLLSESLGYGRKLVQGEAFTLDGELGLGARQSKAQGASEVSNDLVLRLNGAAAYRLSETATLSEELSVEAGENNTISKSVTALTAKVMDDLAMKFSFTVSHISEVPAGSKNTDYETAMTLVYSF